MIENKKMTIVDLIKLKEDTIKKWSDAGLLGYENKNEQVNIAALYGAKLSVETSKINKNNKILTKIIFKVNPEYDYYDALIYPDYLRYPDITPIKQKWYIRNIKKHEINDVNNDMKCDYYVSFLESLKISSVNADRDYLNRFSEIIKIGLLNTSGVLVNVYEIGGIILNKYIFKDEIDERWPISILEVINKNDK